MHLLTVFIYILGHQIILNFYLTHNYFIIRLKKPKSASTSQRNSEALKQILKLFSRSLMQIQTCTEQIISLSQLIYFYFYTLIRFHLNIIAFLYRIEFFNEFIHLGKPYHFLTLLHFYYPRETLYKPFSSVSTHYATTPAQLQFTINSLYFYTFSNSGHFYLKIYIICYQSAF